MANDPGFANVQADYKIIYVDAIEPKVNLGQADDDTIGFNITSTNVVVVSTLDISNVQHPNLQTAEVLEIGAHELAHAIAIPANGHNPLPNHLMTQSITNNLSFLYELDVDEWDLLNP